MVKKTPVEFRAFYRLVRELGGEFNKPHFEHTHYATLDMIMGALRAGRASHGALSADHIGLALACVKSMRMRVELLKSILSAFGPHQAWPTERDLTLRMPDHCTELDAVLTKRRAMAALPVLPAPEPAHVHVHAPAPEPARRALKRVREAERSRSRPFVASDSAESMQGESSSSSSYAPSSSSDSSESARRRRKRVCRESEREMDEVRALMAEADKLKGAWCNALASYAADMPRQLKSIAALRAGVLRARELSVVLGVVQEALARVEQDEPLLRPAYVEQDIMAYIYNIWVCASMPEAELESALDIADHVAVGIACEVKAYVSELAANSVSPAFLNIERLQDCRLDYCTRTLAEIDLTARREITRLINDEYPLYTSFPYWPALRTKLLLADFPVDRLAACVRGGCVARMLIAGFVHHADDMCHRTDGFRNCRARLDAVWEPIETALRALCPPDTTK